MSELYVFNWEKNPLVSRDKTYKLVLLSIQTHTRIKFEILRKEIGKMNSLEGLFSWKIYPVPIYWQKVSVVFHEIKSLRFDTVKSVKLNNKKGDC